MPALSRRSFFKTAAAGLAMPVGIPAGQSRDSGRIDTAWFRGRLAQETERGLKMLTPTGYLGGPAGRGNVSPQPQGSYRPTGLGTGTPTSQGRNLFVLCLGFNLTQKPEFLEAVTRAADFTLARFWDKRYGGLFAQVDPDGKVLDERKESKRRASKPRKLPKTPEKLAKSANSCV